MENTNNIILPLGTEQLLKHADSPKSNREDLKGFNVKHVGDKIELACTDGHTLAVQTYTKDSCSIPEGIYHWDNAPKSTPKGETNHTFTETGISQTGKAGKLTKVDADYPDYTGVLPKDPASFVIGISAELLKRCCDYFLAQEKNYNAINQPCIVLKFHGDIGPIEITANYGSESLQDNHKLICMPYKLR